MIRVVLQPDDLHDLVDQFGADRRPAALDRLTGGSKKGVYRLRLDDQSTAILYVWAAGENGELAAIARGEALQTRSTEDIIQDRARGHLDAAAARDARLADAHDRITDHLRRLRDAVTVRHDYRLIHGELGPDHVLVPPSGAPAIIDIEGMTFFDVEWEHAWLQLRFGDAYPTLQPVKLDPNRLEFYRFAQVLSLIEGPLRIADTDFPDRQWMLALAERNVTKALAVI
ncbi:hypothetical protein [Salinispora pacifica]|uniref:hypothetical protein n=1 Tax=Salinispora pacifica TaxID=351187 RepID=UPI00037096DC|nr:hypothetical protein [Salinispora pacifica]